jgi:hypothetical protein
MMTLLASLLGFFSATFPDLIKLFRDSQDRQHELKILELQREQPRQGDKERLQEIQINADVAEYQAFSTPDSTPMNWVDALNGTVRPVIAYSFFGLYAGMKILGHLQNLPIWSEDDQAIFAGIISFYFGQRAMTKKRL